MSDPNEPKKHHYVPQFLLANFAFHVNRKGKGGNRVWVYDKWQKREYPSVVRDIACERKFNEHVVDGERLSWERRLQAVENDSSLTVAKILRENSLRIVTSEERLQLSHFIALQALRGPQSRFAREAFGEELMRYALQMGASAEAAGVYEVSKEDAKRDSLIELDNCQKLSSLYAAKSWFLCQAPPHTPYWISDNPVVLANNSSDAPPHLGRLGIISPGVEVYLPLSKRIALAMWCPTLERLTKLTTDKVTVLQAAHRRGLLVNQEVDGVNQLERAGVIERARSVRKALEHGVVHFHSDRHVRWLNELQAWHSYRYVFSSEKECGGVIEQVLALNPDTQRGPTLQVQSL